MKKIMVEILKEDYDRLKSIKKTFHFRTIEDALTYAIENLKKAEYRKE